MEAVVSAVADVRAMDILFFAVVVLVHFVAAVLGVAVACLDFCCFVESAQQQAFLPVPDGL